MASEFLPSDHSDLLDGIRQLLNEGKIWRNWVYSIFQPQSEMTDEQVRADATEAIAELMKRPKLSEDEWIPTAGLATQPFPGIDDQNFRHRINQAIVEDNLWVQWAFRIGKLQNVPPKTQDQLRSHVEALLMAKQNRIEELEELLGAKTR